MDGSRQPSFACMQPRCDRRFTSLDRLVTHASKDHFLAVSATGSFQTAGSGRRKSERSLLSALSDKAAGLASPCGVLATLAALAVSQMMRYSLQRELRKVDGIAGVGAFLDLRPSGYVPEDVNEFLDGLGGKGIPVFIRLQARDCFTVALFGAVALSILCTFFLSKLSYPPLKSLNLVPFLLPLIKSLEATLLIALIADYTSGAALTPQKVACAATLTTIKVRLVIPVIVGLTMSLGLAVPARWALRFSEQQYEKQARQLVEELAESDDEGGPGEDEEGIGLDVDDVEENKDIGKGEQQKSPAAKKTE